MKDSYIGLMVEDSSALLVGLLSILRSGNCVVPLNPKFPPDRIAFIAADCRIKTILTDKNNYAEVQRIARESLCLEHVICIDDIDFAEKRLHRKLKAESPGIRPGKPFYVIYTSGSTGKSKGVQITHSNLVPLLLWFNEYFRLGAHTKVLQNLSYTFDFGIFELVTTLLAGGTLYFFDKKSLKDLNDYIDFIHRHKINTIHTTPSFFTAMTAQGKSLSPVKLLHFGGERLTKKIVDDASRLVGKDCYIYNGYGPTETTINSSIFSMHVDTAGKIEAPEVIPIGRPTANNIIYILNGYGKLQPIGVAGELYIGGSGTAGGYVNRPKLTSEKFIASGGPPFCKKVGPKTFHEGQERRGEPCVPPPMHPQLPTTLYKTGDLGRWLPDGNIEFLGRIDYQVKIRGFRIELGEIENRLLEHEEIEEAAVIDRQRGNSETYLCAYMVERGTGDRAEEHAAGKESLEVSSRTTELRKFLSHSLPDYMIPAIFITLQRMPLNPNKKIDRKALPEPGNHMQASTYTAPRDEIERKLAETWLEVLGDETAAGTSLKIGAYSDFFETGGHSLKILNLINAVQRDFKVKLDVQDVFRYPQLYAQADMIRRKETAHDREIRELPQYEHYALSYAQKRLWLLYKFEPHSPAFNLGGRITLNEKVDEAVISEVLQTLTARHESLRTCFKKVRGDVKQIILPDVTIRPGFIDLTSLPGAEREEHRQQLLSGENAVPFDLEKGPLLRVKLLKISDRDFDMLFTMHHIISDGWSLEVLEKEFLLLYESYKKGGKNELPPLRIRYKDFAAWHNRLLADEKRAAAAREFWKSMLQGEIPVPELPYDYSKSDRSSSESAAYRTVVPADLTRALRKLGREEKASLFMVLLAGFNLLLSRISGQEDIVIGVPGAGRQHSDLKNVIGLFVNTLILRNSTALCRENAFTRFLASVRQNMVQALEHQDFPLELICSELKIKYPEVSVFFNMITFGGIGMENLENLDSFHIEKVQDAKFDIVCYLREYKNCIEIETHYFKDLFKPITTEKVIREYLQILADVSAPPPGTKGAGAAKRKRKLKRG